MKIKYKVKEFSEDPLTLKDGDWITLTPNYIGAGATTENIAWEFSDWNPRDKSYLCRIHYNSNKIGDFAITHINQIKKVPKNDKNYKLQTYP